MTAPPGPTEKPAVMPTPAVTIYHARLGPRLAEDAFAWRAAALPPALTQDLGRYLRWQDRQARLFVWLLLRQALIDLGQSPHRLENLTRNPWGRPMLTGGPEFNLSHAGELVVCALGQGLSLGVDVEQVKPLDLADFRACFQEEEWLAITGDTDPLGRFFRFWTAKESVAKAEGQGLHLPLTDILVQDRLAWCRGRPWLLTPLDLAPFHPGHLACDRPLANLILRDCELGEGWTPGGSGGRAAPEGA